MLDYYIFYPICFEVDSHGYNCKCSPEFKNWSRVSILKFTKSFPKILDDIKKLNFRIDKSVRFFKGKILIHLVISKAGISFALDISDSIFKDLGKPFYTVKRIKIEE